MNFLLLIVLRSFRPLGRSFDQLLNKQLEMYQPIECAHKYGQAEIKE